MLTIYFWGIGIGSSFASATDSFYILYTRVRIEWYIILTKYYFDMDDKFIFFKYKGRL